MPELSALVNRGVSPDELSFLFEAWLQAPGSQLTVFPADLRIEARIQERFPGLRSVQERSLAADVQPAFPLVDPLVVATTPATVYRPTMAMNAAQASQVAGLYHRSDLLEPFHQHGYVDIGRHLTRLVLEAADDGHRSDMAAVNRWAEELGLTGWFEWAPYEGSK